MRRTLLCIATRSLVATGLLVTTGITAGQAANPGAGVGQGRASSQSGGLFDVVSAAWALSPVVTLVVFPLTLTGAVVIASPVFQALALLLGVLTLFWYACGALWYTEDISVALLLALPLVPLVSVVHSAGTVWGLVDPPDGFRVTAKTT